MSHTVVYIVKNTYIEYMYYDFKQTIHYRSNFNYSLLNMQLKLLMFLINNQPLTLFIINDPVQFNEYS